MTGIFLLFVVGLWIALVIWLVPKLTKKMQSGAVKTISQCTLFLILLAAPLADEIVSGFQFRALCNEGAVVKVDEGKAAGRTVKLRLEPYPNLSQYTKIPSRQLKNTLSPITEIQYEYYDEKSSETLVSYKVFEAKGGWFIHLLGISEKDSPLTFPSYCAPPDQISVFKKLHITKIN